MFERQVVWVEQRMLVFHCTTLIRELDSDSPESSEQPKL